MTEITIWGGLPRDAILRFTQNGKPYATFTIADAVNFKDDQGQWQKRDESYTDVILWGDAANEVGTFTKGTQVAALGRHVTRSFDDQSGAKRTVLEFKAKQVAKLVKAQGNQPQQRPAPQQQQPVQGDVWGAPGATYNDDESVPF